MPICIRKVNSDHPFGYAKNSLNCEERLLKITERYAMSINSWKMKQPFSFSTFINLLCIGWILMIDIIFSDAKTCS